MARRSDHSRAELEALILDEGHRQMAETGFARFSAREVAKRIGYSIGTLYNVFGSYDRLILAINTRTFQLWAAHLRARLAEDGEDRIKALVEGYFSFARGNPNLWMAIYDHRLPPGTPMPEEFAAQRAELTDIVIAEVAAALPADAREKAAGLARSLIATVHGHCLFALNGTFLLMGESDPFGAALQRVRDSMAAA
ncbi:TetR/AcrR family transcriptional regulator [Flavisphingomonas formosensis]|uniref:TetR/AcrR family transcriptional regulator n=1 Tax=Flavisphingomonas formosensis TaxID=861534 RepID=UPI0012F8A746|nr:TetR/AcrR family transcriptional regulator [Sphingomonas formosensis]